MNPYSTWSIDALKGFIISSESFIASDAHDSMKEMYRKKTNLVKEELNRRIENQNVEKVENKKDILYIFL